MDMPAYLTLGQVAQRYPGLQVWQVRRIFERRFLPEPQRIAGVRVIPAKDMPKVDKALRDAGYIKETAVAS
jgi:hypothetical protein